MTAFLLGDAALKAIVLAAAGAVLIAGTVVARPASAPTEAELLRGYAFATCLAEGYKGTAFEHDAEHAAGLYMELGQTKRAEVYERLRNAARAATPRSGRSSRTRTWRS